MKNLIPNEAETRVKDIEDHIKYAHDEWRFCSPKKLEYVGEIGSSFYFQILHALEVALIYERIRPTLIEAVKHYDNYNPQTVPEKMDVVNDAGHYFCDFIERLKDELGDLKL